jgi:hypothetical protein
VVASRWIPISLLTLQVTFVVVGALQLAPEPAFYHNYYWRDPVFYYPIFVPLISLLFFLGMLVAARQSAGGFILGRELMRFRPPVRLSHEAAVELVREITQIGTSLTRQATPWVILGGWMAFWIVTALFNRTYNNAVLYGVALVYIPGLLCSLLFPLLALSIALRRIRKDRLRRFEEQIESEYGQAVASISDMEAVQEHNSKIRDLQQMIALTNAYLPVVPVGSARLQAIAVGAVLQVFTFWTGLILDVSTLAGLASLD